MEGICLRCLVCADVPGNAFGVFQDYYQTNVLKGYSSDAISWIGSIQNFILFFGVRQLWQDAMFARH